jgi:ribonuclease D
MHDHGLITTETDLRTWFGAIAGSPWVAVDTEFMREKTYYPRLCLIQIATPEHIACIDPLALADLGPLIDVLHDPDILKVFHAAGQDLEVLYLVTGRVPAPVFDTQIAASMLGHGEQIGYANLVQAVLQHEIDKTQSRTDWTQRPLKPEQLSYARDDVRYLTRLYVELQQELERLGRLDWLQPEMQFLLRPELYQPDPANAWRRISGHKRLKPSELAVLRELAAWREAQARDLDRPRRWVIGDDALLAIARAQPGSMQDLRDLRGAPKGLTESQSEDLLQVVRRGRDAPRESWPTLSKRQPLNEAEEVLVDISLALLRELTRRQQISPEAVATRKDVIALMRNEEDAALTRGWRRQIAGNELQRWLQGASTLRCAGHHLELIHPATAPETPARSSG